FDFGAVVGPTGVVRPDDGALVLARTAVRVALFENKIAGGRRLRSFRSFPDDRRRGYGSDDERIRHRQPREREPTECSLHSVHHPAPYRVPLSSAVDTIRPSLDRSRKEI